MIPLKLSLKNFLSYGNILQTIDFGSYPLICLSGKNGYGKSGLLDAMTWAVWGDARKISGASKPDVGLVRLGQTHMLVILEFEFNQNIYRVRREFAKGSSKNYATLDFDMFNETKNEFISLTDKTIRATQEKINNLLGLDFQTFVNSAFFRQGQSNEFSQKSPKERKEILASILSLSKYDQLKSKSLEYVKKYAEEKLLLTKLQENYFQEIGKEESIKTDYIVQEQKISEIDKQISELKSKLVAIEKQRLEFLEYTQTKNLLVAERERIATLIENNNKNILLVFSEWRKFNKQTFELPDIRSLETKRNLLLQDDLKFRSLHAESLQIQERILKTKEIYQATYSTIKANFQQNLLEKKQQINKKEVDKQNLEQTLYTIKKSSNDLQKVLKEQIDIIDKLSSIEQDKLNFEKDFITISAQFEKRRSYYQVLVQKGNWVGTILEDLKDKKITISQNDSPSCPVCEQVLTIKRKQFLQHKFSKEESFFIHRYERIKKLIVSLKEILFLQHEDIKNLNLKKEDMDRNFKLKADAISSKERILIELKKVILEDEKINFDLIKISSELLGIKSLISQEEIDLENIINQIPDILAIKKDLDQLLIEKDKLSYDSSFHIKIQNELNEVSDKINSANILQKNKELQTSRKSKIHELICIQKEFKKSCIELDQKIEKLNSLQQSLDKVVHKYYEVTKQLDELVAQKQQFWKNLGSLKSQLDYLEKLKQEELQRVENLTKINNEGYQYQILATIFGKDGIQALLIEEAIPEIEQEANAILSCITDNQSQIIIESLRDLKKGGVKETLDIQISDSQGIRPYEMFSGGEAFRIDFALRIAISKLLAKRSGTALQTLIIDEGFGSQDEEGLNRLMDAIYAIQKHFSKIIVVSHLPIFKDNFPVHFVVEKTPSGSCVYAVER